MTITRPKHIAKLPEKIRAAAQTGSGTHVVSIIKAAVATVPFAGGIASLMDDYIPSAKTRRIEALAENFAQDLHALRDRIDEDLIQTDEFAFIFEQCFRGAAENYQLEKLAAFRGILINSLVESEIAANEQEYMLSLVNRLTALHIRVLALVRPSKSALHHQNWPSKEEAVTAVVSFIGPRAGVADQNSIRGVLDDLYQASLTTEDTRSVRPAHIGHKPYQNFDLSPYGERFIDFITSTVDTANREE